MTRYIIHGLVVDSDTELPQMKTTDAEAVDIVIRDGDVPGALDNTLHKSVIHEVNESEFLFNVRNVARYYVRDGKEIIISRFPDSSENSVRLFLLGTSLGVLLHQRNLVPLHASAIVTPKGAVLFAGQSGMGKSTTAAAFAYKKGYQLLADDVSVLQERDGEVVLVPGIPGQRLWADTLRKLEVSSDAGAFEAVRPDMEKYNVPMATRYYDAGPLRVASIYILHSTITDEIEINDITGIAKFSTIINVIYRQRILDRMKRQSEIMQTLTTLASQVRLSNVVRPRKGNTIEELLDLLDEDLKR